jgi:polyphosphate kinase
MLVDADRPDLKFPSFTPRFPERIREFGGDCFAAIRAKDIIVHHPYESFDVVVAYLRQAAEDPDVVAIKQTLYRAGKQSAVINALIAAAEAASPVTAVVELKARFDEEQNLLWASAWSAPASRSSTASSSGRPTPRCRWWCARRTAPSALIAPRHRQLPPGHRAHLYGPELLHRRSPGRPRRRPHLQLHHWLYRAQGPGAHLHVAAAYAQRHLRLIDAEITHARAGRPGSIWAKLNSLVDQTLIDKLYEASRAGVDIELVVRGICCLRPGLPGVSDNIRVKSIVGRFLEHSRIWCFGNGEGLPNRQAKVFISSADWMPRNFDRRVEYAAPLENETVHRQVLDQVMVANIIDNEQSWRLQSDGSYVRLNPAPGEEGFNLHHYFMTNPSLSGRGAAIQSQGAWAQEAANLPG